ncbi:hypothetical protein EMIT0P218_210017 [Pseudomonas sp. IT-P218]
MPQARVGTQHAGQFWVTWVKGNTRRLIRNTLPAGVRLMLTDPTAHGGSADDAFRHRLR